MLVATSVLEEGLDVGDCDLIVRFSGANNLTRHLQTKGRARKKETGQVIVLIDPKERNVAQVLEKKEAQMKQVIKSRSCPIKDSTLKAVKVLLQDLDIQRYAEKSYERIVAEQKDALRIQDLTLYVYVEGIARTIGRLRKLEKALTHSLNRVTQLCVVDQIVWLDGDATQISGCDRLFSSNSAVFLVGFKKNEDVGSQDQFLAHICNNWGYLVAGFHDAKFFLSFPQQPSKAANFQHLSTEAARLMSISTGDMMSKDKIRLRDTFEDLENPSLLASSEGYLRFVLKQSTLKMELQTVSTYGFGILWPESPNQGPEENQVFHISIPLRSSPVMTHDKLRETTRIVADHSEKKNGTGK